MFGPKEKRESQDWKGWWGDNPPYHAPVFVLSKNQRDPIAMEGGTTFIFISDGIEAALSQAKEVAGERNVAIAGGAWNGEPVRSQLATMQRALAQSLKAWLENLKRTAEASIKG